jgi:F-type H+-transporting ATPase subunit epsilon
VSDELKLNVLSPERRLVESILVEEVTLPGSEGQIQILPGHAPMIGSLRTGVFNYKARGKSPVYGVISSGFFEVRDDEVYVMAETIELQNEIDIDRAKKAQELAEQTLQAADLDEHSFKKYQLKLQRALIRQNLAGLT